jgi:hypothetical protein
MHDSEPPAVAAIPASAARSWRKRHPVLARVVLYAAFVAIAAIAFGLLAQRRSRDEADRQAGLLTKLEGIDQTGLIQLAPGQVLKVVRDEVLPVAVDVDVIRRAHLTEAAALDGLTRYDEAEKVYAALDANWPAGTPRGSLRVPWANMRIRAGRAKQALELLDAPFATDGWPVEGPNSAAAVRARAEAAAKMPPPVVAPSR